MKATLLALLLAVPVSLFSQAAPDSLVWRYADLTYPLGGFSSKSKVVIDYGETTQAWGKKPELLEDEAGNAIKFKSSADALNWMSVRGWDLVQSYVIDQGAGGGVGSAFMYIHFIMRRKEPYRAP
jgi:hypothetical protein